MIANPESACQSGASAGKILPCMSIRIFWTLNGIGKCHPIMGMFKGLRNYLKMIQVVDQDHFKDGKPAKLIDRQSPHVNVI